MKITRFTLGDDEWHKVFGKVHVRWNRSSFQQRQNRCFGTDRKLFSVAILFRMTPILFSPFPRFWNDTESWFMRRILYRWGMSFSCFKSSEQRTRMLIKNSFFISFPGDMEIFAYFFGPIGILLCVNVLLFLSTARQLTCGLWKRDDVKSTTER